jgi:pimeloyl-ACP methyl ester carboxylesterase
MTPNFLISLRKDLGGGVPGTSIAGKAPVYISSPEGQTYNLTGKNSQTQEAWLKAMDGYKQVLVFVHGFGNDATQVVSRHESVKPHLPEGFALVSFDWPSGDGTGGIGPKYSADRDNAKNSALRLISECLSPLVGKFGSKNVHLCAHSMGAYVTETAFHSAEGKIKINHVFLAAGDVDAANYEAGTDKLNSFLSCCNDLSVYSSEYDEAMKASSWFKKLHPKDSPHRLGEKGFPQTVPPGCTSIQCSHYWEHFAKSHPPAPPPNVTVAAFAHEYTHVWYLVFEPEPENGENDFYGDMVSVLTSASKFPTRAKKSESLYRLIRPPLKRDGPAYYYDRGNRNVVIR